MILDAKKNSVIVDKNLFFNFNINIYRFIHLQILHVGGQVDIIRQAIREVHRNSNDELSTSLTIIDDLIHRHRKIITLSDDIENLFSSIALIQLLWNTLIICFAGFLFIFVSEIDCFDLLIDNSSFFAGCQ